MKIPKYVKTLKELTVFKFKTGSDSDTDDMLMFVGEVAPTRPPHPPNGKIYKIIDEHGGSDWLHETELINIDSKTIRPYDSDYDIDFYGLAG